MHDASTGWATVSEPAVGYSFNRIFAVDATIPIYNFRLAASHAAKPRPDALLVPLRAELGDVILGLHAQFVPPALQLELTVSATVPTGDELYGLSSGRATFDLSNVIEHSFRFATPSLEIGVGDSTTLANRLVLKNFTSLGPLAHFQLGSSFALPLGASFSASAYEQLPIGDQKIYQSVTRNKTTTLVVAGRSLTEDNGFTTSFDLPVDSHTTLSAYYNRSLRLHDDVVSIGLTFVLRGSKRDEDAAADELLRQVQRMDAPPIQPPPAAAEKSAPPH